jgi:uncharacterized tellurite resistance protein B-like protein
VLLSGLDRKDRLRLMRFVCSFAWADLEVRPEERDYVRRLLERLELDPADRERVRQWLRVPPDASEVDPTAIPLAQRKLFVRAMEGAIAADGEIAPEERENLSLFKALLREEPPGCA